MADKTIKAIHKSSFVISGLYFYIHVSFQSTWLDNVIQEYAAKLPYFIATLNLLFHLETKLHQRGNVGEGKEGSSLMYFSVFVM